MDQIQLGLIGCGRLGRTHAEAIRQISGASFAAYADTDAAAAENARGEFGGRYATTDVQQLFHDAEIDAVYICTRHDSHARLAIAAAKAGKHIFIEKPLALHLEDCQAIAAEVERTGVYLMPGFKMRYYPLLQKAHEFIPHPQVLVGQMMDNRWGDGIWPQDPVQGGGNVHSQGCHTTDILRFLVGAEPSLVWAVGGAITHPGHPCIDQCVACIQFVNGAVASWIQGDAAESRYTSKFFFELFGDGKSVQLYDRLKSATFYDGQKHWTEHREEEEGFLLENQEFIAALSEGRPPAIGITDGIQATKLVLAAESAIRTGQVQQLAGHRATNATARACASPL